MPFGMPHPPPTPEPQSGEPPLISLGGLYPTRSGNALTGNLQLEYVNRGELSTRGEQLLDLVKSCIEQGLPLRLLVFENTRSTSPKAPPYTVKATVGGMRSTPATYPGPTANEPAMPGESESIPDWVQEPPRPSPPQTVERVPQPFAPRRPAPRPR